MLDLNDFVSDRGGNPNGVKESQRRRFAPEEAVDEVIFLYEEARRGTVLSVICSLVLKRNKLIMNTRAQHGMK